MRLTTLLLLASLAATSVHAVSYLPTMSIFVGLIQNTAAVGSGNHYYSGINLEPGAFLAETNLTGANLTNANRSGL